MTPLFLNILLKYYLNITFFWYFKLEEQLRPKDTFYWLSLKKLVDWYANQKACFVNLCNALKTALKEFIFLVKFYVVGRGLEIMAGRGWFWAVAENFWLVAGNSGKIMADQRWSWIVVGGRRCSWVLARFSNTQHFHLYITTST